MPNYTNLSLFMKQFEKTIFHLQIIKLTVPPVQTLSRPGCCILTVLKKGSSYKQTEPVFPEDTVCEVLDDVELCFNMTIQKILMTRSRDMGKNLHKMGLRFFSHLGPPKSFFQKRGSATFGPFLCPNFEEKVTNYRLI